MGREALKHLAVPPTLTFLSIIQGQSTLSRLTSASHVTLRKRFALLVRRDAIPPYMFTRTTREGTSTGFGRV